MATTLNCKLVSLIIFNIINIILSIITIILSSIFSLIGFQQTSNMSISACLQPYLVYKYSFMTNQMKTGFVLVCVGLGGYVFGLVLVITVLVKLKKMKEDGNQSEMIKKSDQNQEILTMTRYGVLYIAQTIGGLANIVSFGYYLSFILDFTSQLTTCTFTFNPIQLLILPLLTGLSLLFFIIIFFVILNLYNNETPQQQRQNKYKQMVNMTQQPQNNNNNNYNDDNDYGGNKYNNKYLDDEQLRQNNTNQNIYDANSNLNTSNNRKNSVPSIFTLNMTQDHHKDNLNNTREQYKQKQKQPYHPYQNNQNNQNTRSSPNSKQPYQNNRYPNNNNNNQQNNTAVNTQQKYLSPYERSGIKQTYQEYKQRQLRQAKLKKFQDKNNNLSSLPNNNNYNRQQQPYQQNNQFSNPNTTTKPKQSNPRYFNQVSRNPNKNELNSPQKQKSLYKPPSRRQIQPEDTKGQLVFHKKGDKSRRQNYNNHNNNNDDRFIRQEQDYLRQNARGTILPNNNVKQSTGANSRKFVDDSYGNYNDSFKQSSFNPQQSNITPTKSRAQAREGVLTSFIRGKFN